MYTKAFTHRIKEIAAGVSVAIANEHGKSFPPKQVEQAVASWLENRLEDLAEDAVELLTEPRFGYANDFIRAFGQRTEVAQYAHSVRKLKTPD